VAYFENASYLSGNHLTRYYYSADSGLGIHQFGLHDRSVHDTTIAKVADNRLIRPVETVVSMLTEMQPEGRVEPGSDLPEDEDAADLSQLLLDLVWEKPLGMPKKIRQAAMVGTICGTVAMEIEYGPTDVPVEVPKFKIRKRKNPFADDEGQPDEIEEQVEDGTEVEFKSNIMARVWTPFHLNPDPSATCPEDMKWISRSSFEDVEWVKEEFNVDAEGYYPENLDGVGSDSATKSPLFWWAKFQDILESPQYAQHGGGLTPNSFNVHGGSAPGQCIFTVIDVKPSRQHPRGRTLILASGKLLYCGDARAWSEKYPERWHPYAFWGWFQMTGRFWAIPLLSEIVPLQKKINAIDALVHANRQYMSIGQWMVPKHSKVPAGMTSGIPGADVKYTAIPGMSDPAKVKHEPLPAELLQERADLLQAIDYIAASGVTDGAQISKSAARSGVLLDFLRKEKLRSKSGMLQDFETFLETIAQNILIEFQLNMTQEDPDLTQRLAQAAREHSSLTIQTFVGASLRDHHAVKMDVASALMKSPEAQEQKAMDVLQYGNAQGGLGPAEKQAVYKAIGFDKFIKNEENASVARARRLIRRIVTGQVEDLDPEKISSLTMPGVDSPRAMLPIFQRAILADKFNDYERPVKAALYALFEVYQKMNAAEQDRAFQMQLALAQAGVKPGGGQAGPQGG
jgi:hypothetical protein